MDHRAYHVQRVSGSIYELSVIFDGSSTTANHMLAISRLYDRGLCQVSSQLLRPAI